MSFQDPASNTTPSLKLLSLDGGGIRGLSSLIILKYLMKRVRPKNPPKPCEFFDLIGGTSTGGLIAIMLGRLRMDVDTCINKYVELSSAAFQPKRSKANIFGKAKDLWKTDGAYRSDCLATEFKKLAQALECDEQSKLIHPDTTCRVFVCAFTKALNTPVRLRSYITEDSVDTLAGSGCSIWEAARATSAAAVFFDPIEVGRQKYVDGATGFNNPVEVVLEEAVSIWPDAVSRIQCLVSIGTGASELRDFGDNLKEVINTLKAISTETEETEKRFFKNHKHLGVGDRYFRFNVDKGLGGVGLDEHQKVDKVEAATEAYLEGLRVKQAVEAFIAARAPQNSPVKADVKESYLRWLEYIDPLKSHNDARQYRTTNSTGEWFLRGEFERWKIQPRSFLWLCAKAGSGKTVLSSAIIDEIEQQHLGALAYFYFSFQSKERQDVRHFKYSILIQIVRSLARQDPQRPDHFYVPRAFRELYEGYQPSRDPKTEDLDATFLGVLNESKETYFVVDALDECPSSTDRKAVITFLAELSHNSRSRTHILITSRREEDIEITISEMPNEKSVVPFEIIKINADIRNHLQDRMEKEPYRRWSDALKSKVVNHLTELADGVFRWVDLQIRDLGGKAREKDVDRALKRLPKTLGETYQRILERIDEENYTEEAVVILRWLAYGHRPLLLSEAAEIAAFEITKAQPLSRPDDYSLSFTPDNRFPSPSWVRRILSGLVTVSGIEDRSSFPDEEVSSNLDGTISFAHFSVKEYLESAGVSPPHFHLEDKSCQWFILKSCFAYIHYYDTTTPEPSDSDPFPLLLYSCKWLWRHAMTLWGDPDQSITRSAIKALTAPLNELHGTAFALSIKAALDLKKEQTYIEMVPTFKEDRANKVSPSLFSDCLGKFDNEGNFVELGFDLESPSALHSASAMGEVDLVKLMLNAGVDVNPERVYRGPKQGDYGTVFNWTPLHIAVLCGHDATVRLLLERGADIEATHYSWGKTTLLIAAEKGQEAMVRLLLDNGANPKATDGHWPVLHKVMHLLQEEMAGFTAKNESGYTVPHSLRNQHIAILRMLVEGGGDIADSRRWTALHLAARDGNETLVQLLLEYQVDINARTDSGDTALHWALYYGHDGVVRQLVEKGADVKAKNNKYGNTTLHKAGWKGSEEVVKLLLDGGVDVNAQDWLGHTALWEAALNGNETMVRLLIESGADINIRTESGSTALDIAAYHGHVAIVQHLLKAGADPRIRIGYEYGQSSKFGEAVKVIRAWQLENPRD